jgi:hypothetical protein
MVMHFTASNHFHKLQHNTIDNYLSMNIMFTVNTEALLEYNQDFI